MESLTFTLLLPSYRGPTPIETAIANGDKETGVTIMKLAPEMDAGPIYIQKIYLDPAKKLVQIYIRILQLLVPIY